MVATRAPARACSSLRHLTAGARTSSHYHWRPPMSAEAQLQYEGRVRYRQAAIAIAAGVLVMVAAILGLIGPHAKVNELTLGLITDHKRGALDLIAGIVTACCQVAVAATLVFLFRCSKARRPEAPAFLPILAIVGGAVTAICAIVNPIVLHSKVNDVHLDRHPDLRRGQPADGRGSAAGAADRRPAGLVAAGPRGGADLAAGDARRFAAAPARLRRDLRRRADPVPDHRRSGRADGVAAGGRLPVQRPLARAACPRRGGPATPSRGRHRTRCGPGGRRPASRRASRRGAPASVPAVDGPAIEAESSTEQTRSSTPKRKRKRRAEPRRRRCGGLRASCIASSRWPGRLCSDVRQPTFTVAIPRP